MSERKDADKPLRIEDYAMIAGGRSAALVGRNGSVDWLCWPSFDSDACLAALLGTSKNGRWRIAPEGSASRVERRYVGDTLVLETVFVTADGEVALTDFMPTDGAAALVRRVEGRRGRVALVMELVLRFEYGMVTPWLRDLEGGGVQAIAGPSRVVLRTPATLERSAGAILSRFEVSEGERVDFLLAWGDSSDAPPDPIDADTAERRTRGDWQAWADKCAYRGPWKAAVLRSLLTLKALSYVPTGAITAAATASLPEKIGGERNWDYRICWLRDAALTLLALMAGGYVEEAGAWRAWLHRAVAGDPQEMQTMYGLKGERRLTEWTADWLPGYEGSTPVRIGNAAAGQLQLDVFGELMGAFHIARLHGIGSEEPAWPLQLRFMEHLEAIWEQPDNGIWEVRGQRQQFTHSKVMCWFAVDCSIRDAEAHGLEAPLERWRALRDRIHALVCAKGFDAERNTFTRAFGDKSLDATLLLIPQTGFLPFDDPRVVGTVKAVEEELMSDGFVLRYRTEGSKDGLPAGEGAFLACTFWLANAYSHMGRREEATALFERALGCANDLGLLSEEYDLRHKRLVGNFPQAYSHLALVGAAFGMEGISLARMQEDG